MSNQHACTWGIGGSGDHVERCGKPGMFTFKTKGWFGQQREGALCKKHSNQFGLALLHKGESVTFFRLRNS